MESIRVCLAGATGWVGRELCLALHASDKFHLVAAVAPRSAGHRVADVLGIESLDFIISKTVAEAFATPCDVLVDYTRPEVVFDHVKQAIEQGVSVVVGTSGLTEEQFSEIDQMARSREVGVLACGNFAITAILLQKLAVLASRVLPHWEIIDYATASKPDAPSSTARELAAKLSEVATPEYEIPVAQTVGEEASRGATIQGMQVHSIRLPGFTFSFEIVFGSPGERLSLRHDAGESARPYVLGTLHAIEEVRSFYGLRRGLESLLPSGPS
jgi:4-hydroxy-tetrahydrodipicolinate reductase